MVLKPNREEYSKSVVSRELLSARKTLRNKERIIECKKDFKK